MLFIGLLLTSVILNIYGYVREDSKHLKLLHMGSFFLFLAGFVILINMKNNLNESNTFFQVLFLIAALILGLISIFKLRINRDFKDHVITAIGLFSSAVISFAIISNYIFFIDKENSGFINPKFIKNDTMCSNNAFIYFARKGNKYFYRCPIEIAPDFFIVIGNQFNYPLIPWPSYYAGTSKAIEHALHTKEGDQIHLD